mgnify:FL=1
MSKRRDVFLKSMARTCVTFALIIIVSLGSRGGVLYFLSIDPIMIVFCIYVTLCIAAIAWRIFKEEII